MKSVGAILLAAGASSRMKGADKLTREIEGIPLLRRSALAAQRSISAELFIVTGAYRDTRLSALNTISFTEVSNPNWKDGLGTSIAAGVRAASHHDALLILLADMPDITAGIINQLIDCFAAQGTPQSIIAPQSEAGRGNPVLFGAEHFKALQKLTADHGAGSLIATSADVEYIEVMGDASRQDLDTHEDWDAYLAQRAIKHISK